MSHSVGCRVTHRVVTLEGAHHVGLGTTGGDFAPTDPVAERHGSVICADCRTADGNPHIEGCAVAEARTQRDRADRLSEANAILHRTVGRLCEANTEVGAALVSAYMRAPWLAAVAQDPAPYAEAQANRLAKESA